MLDKDKARQAFGVLYSIARKVELNGDMHDQVRLAGQALDAFITASGAPTVQEPEEGQSEQT